MPDAELSREARAAYAAQEAVEKAVAELESLRQSLLASIARINQARSAVQGEHVEIEKKTYRRRFLDEEGARLDGRIQKRHVHGQKVPLDGAGGGSDAGDDLAGAVESTAGRLDEDADEHVERNRGQKSAEAVE